MSSLAKMMDYEIEINKINDAIEMLDDKKAYYWLEKLNDVNFDIMCINKIFDAEIEKLKKQRKWCKKCDKRYRKINTIIREHEKK